MDVTVLSDVQATLATVTAILRARDGELVGVVNVAGVILLAPYETASDEELRAQFDVNFFAVLTVSRTFLPLLKESKGRLINIGSAASFIVAPSAGIYSATKAAVAAATDAMRMELRNEGVGVSLIEPGCIRTRAWEVGIARLHTYNSTPNLPASGITTDHAFSTKSGVPRENYETLFSRLEGIYRLAITLAFPPKHIAQHVEHAIRSRFPRARYLGGPDVKVADFMMRFVPSGVVAAAFGWVLWSQG
ncbi:hypothetical protein HKX48_003803 [Thoreauomyces humboldtii]|nr:hypothetical protein HKX48_003803 [Thoreauomyces humboldtii]